MSSQQHTDADSTILALDAQLDDVIDELYNNDQQTGRFISTTQGHLVVQQQQQQKIPLYHYQQHLQQHADKYDLLLLLLLLLHHQFLAA